ncbi:MAG: hypothetical protein OWQ48_05115 [Desulfurococcus sp.]|nr:hypothetical protein [Desulfurococcus sp.]
MSGIALLLAAATTLGGLYAALTSEDERALFSSTMTLVVIAFLFLEMGEPLAAVVQLSLASGFLAAAGFLIPELRGRKLSVLPGLGAISALLLFMVFLYIGSRLESQVVHYEKWVPLAIAMASLPLAAALLALKLLMEESSGGS